MVMAGLIADRENKGADWCRRRGVGARRKVLASVMAGPLVQMGEGKARREASEMLETVCAVCGRCELAQGLTEELPAIRKRRGGAHPA